MTTHPHDKTPVNWIAAGAAVGLVGGLVGGLAEVLVVGAYSRIAGTDAAGVAGAIATAVRVDPGSAITGLAVHMALSAGLGVALLAAAKGSGLLRTKSASMVYGWAMLVLGAIWSLNFLVVLPIVSPSFVHLLPYPVTLASKLLFAVAAVATLRSIPTSAASPLRLRSLARATA